MYRFIITSLLVAIITIQPVVALGQSASATQASDDAKALMLKDLLVKLQALVESLKQNVVTNPNKTAAPVTAGTVVGTTIDVSRAQSDGGYAWAIYGIDLGGGADTLDNFTASPVRLFENGVELKPAHSNHADIRSLGGGRFSHFSDRGTTRQDLRFSASDNSDPRSNGRTYSYVRGTTVNVPTLTLSLSTTSVTPGQSATLSWSSANTTSCTGSGAWSGTKSASGSQTVTPTTNAAYSLTYSLTCTGGGGSVTKEVTLTVAPQVIGTTIDVSRAQSDGGYAWAIYGIDLGGGADTLDNFTLSGVRLFENGVELKPAHSQHADIRTYGKGRFSHFSDRGTTRQDLRFSASDNSDPRLNGRIYSYTRDSNASAPATTPPTVTFTTSASSVTSGQSATLSWTSTGATSCTASGGWTGTKAISGTTTVAPITSTTYTIACTGSGGSVSKSVTISAQTTTTTASTPATYTLTTSVAGNGTIFSTPIGITCGADCTETYTSGTAVKLTATPSTGSTFTGWSGACSGTATTCTLSMTQARSVIATFTTNSGTPSTVTTTTSGGSCIANSTQTILNDMSQVSTYPIAQMVNGVISEFPEGSFPSKYAHIAMGNYPHGASAPTWWKPSTGYEYLRTISWNNVTPWLVILTGTGNKAVNTRIEMRNIKSYYKSKKTGQWVKIGESPISGFNCPPGVWDNCSGTTDLATQSDGTKSLKPAGTGSNFHGWGSGVGSITDPSDVEAYYSTVEARLVGTDAASAQYMLMVGTDYYPSGIGVNQMGGYNPGSGFSRSKGITTDWQSFNYATVDNAWSVINKAYVTTATAFTQVPPPLTSSCTSASGQTNSTPAPTTTTVIPSTAFSTGSRVSVVNGPVNVRSSGATTASILDTQATGALGTVVGGPVSSNGYIWWSIDYDSGTDGWSAEIYLTKSTAAVTSSATPTTYTLTTTVSGNGTIFSTPTGITCGTDCSETYTSGTIATLVATPGTGSTFTGWSGACSGTAITCAVSMSQARSVSATFSKTVIVSPTPTQSGSLPIAPTPVSTAISGSGAQWDGSTPIIVNNTTMMAPVTDPNGSGRTVNIHRVTQGGASIWGGVRSEQLWIDRSEQDLVPGRDIWMAFAVMRKSDETFPVGSGKYDEHLVFQTHTPQLGDTQPDIGLFASGQQSPGYMRWRVAYNTSGDVDANGWMSTEGNPTVYTEPLPEAGQWYRYVVHYRPGYQSSHNPILEVWRAKSGQGYEKIFTYTGYNTYNTSKTGAGSSYPRIGLYKWSSSEWTSSSVAWYITPLYFGVGSDLLSAGQASLQGL